MLGFDGCQKVARARNRPMLRLLRLALAAAALLAPLALSTIPTTAEAAPRRTEAQAQRRGQQVHRVSSTKRQPAHRRVARVHKPVQPRR